MNIVCPECKKEFAIEESLDHSWISPVRDFGCPHCRTFLVNNPNKNPWMAGGMIMAAVFGVPWTYQGYVKAVPVMLAAGIAFLAIGLILLLVSRSKFQNDIKNLRKINHDRS